MAYRVEINSAAQKQVLSLPRPAQVEIARAVDRLRDNPRPSGCRKLRGTDLWRIRLRRYRVVYIIEDESRLITIVKVAVRREDIYKGL